MIGFVKIAEDKVGIVEKKWGGPRPSRLIALNGEVGFQADILRPGLHPSYLNDTIHQVPVTKIADDEIGLVEANDGEPLEPGKMFGKVVDCDNFQNARKFLENGGQRGQQLAILTAGTYWINTKLFTIRKQSVIHISANEIGLVEANDGIPLPPGKMFGKVVACNNFEDAHEFIKNGGERGQQLAILTAGTYWINTNLFTIRKQSVIDIYPDEIGLVEANDGIPLPPGRMFGKVVDCKNFQDAAAFLNNGGESGQQLTILTAGNYQINTNLFTIRKQRVINVPQGEIALVIANDGANLPEGQILGKVVDCNNFQDAAAFINEGGQKGKQRAILTAGTYQINTDLFTVITAANAAQHGMNPNHLRVYTVDADKIGIVTTFDGAAIAPGEIAGPIIQGHDNFQNPQKFIERGGCKGLQQEVVPSGSWHLNPWFVKVEQVPLTTIEVGTVGVVISHVGNNPENNASHEPVENGYRGICKQPLYPGKYPINTKVKDVVIVPTHQITLDWSNKQKPPTNYDANLNALNLRSKDGFAFDIEVAQVISIAGENAPRMISCVGSPGSGVWEPTVGDGSTSINALKFTSIKNLVTRVLEPMVGNHFRNSAQNYEAIDFLKNRSDRQREAIDHIKSALSSYGVEAVDTLIGEIDLPDELEKILTDRKIAEEKLKTYQAEQVAEEEHQKLMYAKHQTETQKDVAIAEANVKIAEKEAEASVQKAKAEAQALRIKGEADAFVTQAIVNFIGSDNYTKLEIATRAAENQLPVVPGANATIFVDSQGGIPTSVSDMSALQFTAYMDTALKNKARLSELPKPQPAALPQSHIVCPNCQTKNPLDHNFCFKCGIQLH
ncbi:SPFH domain-containing protein [Microseira wollei]|uniref:Band 7 domain-containing protein n=1 Tax=Microseira wollei NIES-4236 TaxID=2530354 RepID=A0AAV3XCH7_9CYAN|nr:SPFH domain-containing protein [Microseira wollei]GET39918.1 hypothetical protein MiSe_46900 [Microseira wollei NIES-4236]